MSVHFEFVKISTLVMSFCAIMFSGCGAPVLDTSQSDFIPTDSVETFTTDVVIAGNIIPLQLNGSNLDVELPDLGDSEEIMVLLNSYQDSIGDSGFQLGFSQNQLLTQLPPDDEEQDFDTEDFHELLRQKESQLHDEPYSIPHSDVLYQVSLPDVGSQRSFKVISNVSGNSHTTVTATLRYRTNDVDYYVDNRNLNSLTNEQLAEVAADFKVAEMRNLFGDESDVNDDGQIAVLITQAVNELGTSNSSIITGFFHAIDLFSVDLNAASNEMEIFYVLAPDPNGDFGFALSADFAISNLYPSVFNHEFQHMISFNQHYFLRDGQSETVWLNEALSHLAEDIISVDSQGYMTQSGPENPSRVNSYLLNIQDVCFVCGGNLEQRGGSYLFLRYLYEQAQIGNLANVIDGADLIARLEKTNLTGLDNLITAVFGDAGTDDDLIEILNQFSLAIYYSNTGAFADDRYNFRGINLRGDQGDNRFTFLNGPVLLRISEFPHTDIIQGTSFIYMSMKGKVINDQGGVLHIDLDPNIPFGGFILRQ